MLSTGLSRNTSAEVPRIPGIPGRPLIREKPGDVLRSNHSPFRTTSVALRGAGPFRRPRRSVVQSAAKEDQTNETPSVRGSAGVTVRGYSPTGQRSSVAFLRWTRRLRVPLDNPFSPRLTSSSTPSTYSSERSGYASIQTPTSSFRSVATFPMGSSRPPTERMLCSKYTSLTRT